MQKEELYGAAGDKAGDVVVVEAVNVFEVPRYKYQYPTGPLPHMSKWLTSGRRSIAPRPQCPSCCAQ